MAWAQIKKKKKKKKKPYADYDLCPRPMAWAQVKKPYADYDLRPRPMAWAQVKKKKKNPTQIIITRPCARVNLCPGGFSCCIKLDGLSNLKYCLNFLGKSAGCT